MEAAAAKRRELEWDQEVERRGAEPQSTDKIGASEEELSRETTPDFWPISTLSRQDVDQVVCFHRQDFTLPMSCWCQATDMTGEEKLTVATHSQSSQSLAVWSSLPLSTRSPFSGSYTIELM